jgi:serine/threonine protein kinase
MSDFDVSAAKQALDELNRTLQLAVVYMGDEAVPIRAHLTAIRRSFLGAGSFGTTYSVNLIDTITKAEKEVVVKYVKAEHFSIFELVGLNMFGHFIGVFVRNKTNDNGEGTTYPHTDSGFTFLCSVSEIQNIQIMYPDCEFCIVMTLFSCCAIELPDDIMCDVNVIDALTQLVEQLIWLHSRGFQHNDLRADNVLILLLPNEIITFHVADFGCAYMSVCDADAKFIDCELTSDDHGIYNLIVFFINKKCMKIPEHIRKDLSIIAEHLIDEDHSYENHGMPKTFEEFYQWLLVQKQTQNQNQ